MSSEKSDWQEVVDKKSGKRYFYNKKTRETTWNKPDELAQFEARQAAAAAAAAPQLANGGDENKVAEEPALPPGWAKNVDPSSGKVYYYNKKTKETSWKLPALDASAAAPAVAVAPVSPRAAAPSPTSAAASANAAASSSSIAMSASSSSMNMSMESTGAVRKADPFETGDEDPEDTGDMIGNPEGGLGASSSSSSSSSAASKAPRRQRTGQVSPDGQWEEVVDPTSNKKYWYNKTTKATAWVLPSSAKVVGGPDKSLSGQDLSHLAMSDGLLEKKLPRPNVGDANEPASDLERPSDRMLKLKQALNDRDNDAIRKIDPAGGVGGGGGDDDDDEPEELRFAKHRHGWFNRTFRLGKVADEEQLLTFKKSLIKKALLKKNRDLDAECVQAFKNVMNYMGDRKSSKPPNANAQKLIQNALVHPAGLRDEIYLQLCKQTTANPNPSSTTKGWELIMICLASFPPSKQVKKFLMSYFENTKKDEAAQEVVRNFASEGLNRLEKIVALGQRKQVPSELEIECIKTMKPVPIRINLVDGSFKSLQVDAYTFAKDIEIMMCSKLNLALASPFALYESNSADTNVERLLDAKDRVLDILASWEKMEHLNDKEDGDHAESKALLDLNAERFKDGMHGTDFNQFLFKAKLVLKTSEPDVMADPEAINMLYMQAIHDLVTARYPAKDKDVTVLAALQLQATFGDFQPDAHGKGWLLPRLHEFMPAALLNGPNGKRSDAVCQEWETKILDKYSKIAGFTSLEAKLNYLDYVQEWPFYGATFFSVEQRQFKDYPSPITLGITCEGVILMHPQKRMLLENYHYVDIVTWGHSDERFIVVVGNIVQQRKLIFKTVMGKTMNNLIHDYVKFKVKNRSVAAPKS